MTPEQIEAGWREARIAEIHNLMQIHGITLEDIRDTVIIAPMSNMGEPSTPHQSFRNTVIGT